MIGQAIAHFQIEARIGAGGMGEVYRARDTRLGRSVAVKLLPEEFARDPDRIARFEREAKLLASLNHANIAALYGLEQSGGKHFLIMELVEGETLAEQIQRGPIPAEDALKIAHQMAEALEAAHEKGIVHRDLKPANVKITPEGKVKVLDFGLAKAIEEASPTPNSLSPTLSIMATNAGVILGTAGYMSPEQARGHATDQRSDIFSFACVLYEMLTGRRAFPGETITDVIASIVARDPDWRAIPPSLHPKTDELIRRCLAKNRRDRWHAIADVRVELETIMADPHGLKVHALREASRQPLWRRALLPAAMMVFGALIAVVGTLAVLKARPSLPPAITRFHFALPDGQRIQGSPRIVIAMSPDGTNIVYATSGQMYRRNMGDMEVRPIQGTSASDSVPFFSPDGRWVGYYSATDRSLKKIALAGGSAVSICEMGCDDSSLSPVWNSDDYIYIGRTKSIIRVSANGGKPENVITLKDDEIAHRPQILPGGDAVLFTLQTGGTSSPRRWDNAQIVVQSLTSDEREVLIPSGSDGRYVPTGHLVYAVGSTLFAVSFDLETRRVSGDPTPIIEDLRRGLAIGGGGAAAQFAFSDNGSMAYIPRADPTANEWALALVDRSGGRTLLNIPPGPYSNPRISPDGKQLTVQVGEVGEGQERAVWVSDMNGVQPIHKLTFEGHSEKPLWTRDRGRQRIVFTSDREGDNGLFWQWVDGGPAERFARIEGDMRPQAESWSPEGNVLIFSNRSSSAAVGGGIFMLSPGADQKPKLIIDAPGGNSSLSPDGRWLAHSWFESGRRTVYVQPFPPTGEKHQITTDGTSPLWSPDGQQLFFLRPGAATQQLMAVDVRTERGFVAGKITPLPIQGIVTAGPRSYDITPDGKYFLVIVSTSQAKALPAPRDQINVTLNWFEELKRRVARN